jgi:hypothetical protein
MPTMRHITIGPNGQPRDETGYLSPIQAAEYAQMFLTDPQQHEEALQDAYARGVMTPEIEQAVEQYARQHGVTPDRPSGDSPRNTFTHQNNGWNSESGKYDTGMNMSGLGGAIMGGAALAGPTLIGPALAGLGGGGGAASLAESAVNPAGTAAPGVVDLAPTLGTSTAPGVHAAAQSGLAHTGVTSQVAGKTGVGGFLSKLDPTALLLSGLSIFGGSGDPFQKRTGFTGAADPVAAVTSYLDAVKSLGSTLARRQPQALGPVEHGTPHPVSIPGVPFQIGGGLGTDPSLKARLEPQGLAVDPFGGSTSSGARRRQP